MKTVYLMHVSGEGGAKTNDRRYATALITTLQWTPCTYQQYKEALSKARKGDKPQKK